MRHRHPMFRSISNRCERYGHAVCDSACKVPRGL